MEKFWSGGTKTKESDEPQAEVFLNGDTLEIGVFSSSSEHTKIFITEDEALRLSRMLQEAVQKAQLWRASQIHIPE